ncbi:MAG: GNAT family N-acetyltransferase [Candidatus Eisenbacteria bacterium]
MKLRAFEPADIAAVRALWATCEGLGDGPGDSEAGITRFLERNPGLSQLALEDGAIVGAVLCGHDGRRGFVYRLGVASTHRRQGIARTLVERCLERLKTEGLERTMLFVLADNAEARGFWESVSGRWRETLVLYSIDLGA